MSSVTVPRHIHDQVVFSLETLRRVAESVERMKQLESKVGSNGRYQADIIKQTTDEVQGAKSFLNRFRLLASKNGVDAEIYIASLGGEVEIEITSDAENWL